MALIYVLEGHRGGPGLLCGKSPGLRSKSHLCRQVRARAGSGKVLPQEGFECKIRNQAEAAARLRDRIASSMACNRMGSEPWACTSLRHEHDNGSPVPPSQGESRPCVDLPAFFQRQSSGATVRLGVVQLLLAICDRQPWTRAPLRGTLLSPHPEPSWSLWELQQVSHPRHSRCTPPFVRSHVSAWGHACMPEDRPP